MTKQDDDRTAAKAHAQRRAGQQAKFVWAKAVTADRGISSSAARTAASVAMNTLYSKEHFRATRKYIAELSGLSYGTAKRAVVELTEQRYWTVEQTSGDANLYTIISPNERMKMWTKAEAQYYLQRQHEEWQREQRERKEREAQEAAELERRRAEITARQDFEMAVFDATHARCGNTDFAMEAARDAWAAHQRGELTLEAMLEQVAGASQESFPAPDPEPTRLTDDTDLDRGRLTSEPGSAHQRAGVGSLASRGRLTRDSLNSGNEPSTRSSRSNKTVEDIQELTARRPEAGRARFEDQEPPRPHSGCNLCNDDGHAVSLDGGRVIEMIGEEIGEEYELTCRHSRGANIEKILNIRESSDGYWDVNFTGYGIEVDGEELSEDLDSAEPRRIDHLNEIQ